MWGRGAVGLRCAGEEVKCSAGFIEMSLSVGVSEPMAHEQLDLLGQESRAAEKEFTYLIDRLRARLGSPAVVIPQLVETHLPEQAFRLTEIPKTLPRKPREESKPLKFRPLHLLPEPAEVHCMASPSVDLLGDPVSFTHSGRSYQVTHLRGPERICGVWWEGRNKTRDYFDIESESGRRFWLFRVVETRKWYLHGIFD